MSARVAETARPPHDGPWLARCGDGADVALVGGKAAGLAKLVELGLPVPRYVVLTSDAYRACCPGGAVPDGEGERLAEVLDAIWTELGAGARPLAVRSSAVEEDSATRSWAGQMETYLNVDTRQALGRAVLGSWSSLHGERARAYRDLVASGADDPPPAGDMAVVIQEMLVPSASGVMFTRDPVTGDEDRMIVSAVLGLGEGLVSGTLDADTFVLDRSGNVVERDVVEKTERVEPHVAGGTKIRPVRGEEASAPALPESTLGLLARHAIEAEIHAGMPLDIEFAVAEERLWFLQARPITTVSSGSSAEECVWDNANIVESYPGITLPMTFSFIRRAYFAVYWQFCQLLGMGEEEIRGHEHMLRNMLGLHAGRVYYNLRNWYRLVSLLPGFRHNRRFMEGMMGVAREGGEESDRISRSRGLLSLGMTTLRAVWLQATLDHRVRRFHATFDRIHSAFDALPYESMDPTAVLDAYRRVERALLWRWKAPIVNDFSVMVFYGLLKHLTVRWGVDPEGHLHNALVARQGGVESTEVSDRLEALASTIREDPSLQEAVVAAPLQEVYDLIRGHPVCGPVLDAYMDRFGDRCVAELKLESRTMRDDPTPLMAALQASLRRDPGDPAYERIDASDEAERAVRRRLPAWRRSVYRWVLARARTGIRNRENQRLARTRAFALVRRMVRGIGRSFAASGLLEEWEDIFYLELDEVMALCDGTTTLADPRALVAERKAEFRGHGEAPALPDRFVTRGVTVVSDRVSADVEDDCLDGRLRGLAAYPGVVERDAVVMPELEPERTLRGEILVTRQTDPGWVILFPSIGGLVVERGSMLSHSAIVAREMGIPAVVGVRGAMSAIETGDRVRLDGSSGLVQVVGSEEERA